MIWHQYHKRVTKLLGPDFKRDWLSKGAVAVSVAAPMLVAVFALKWLWGRLLP